MTLAATLPPGGLLGTAGEGDFSVYGSGGFALEGLDGW